MYGLLAICRRKIPSRTVCAEVEANPKLSCLAFSSRVLPQIRYTDAGDRETACPPQILQVDNGSNSRRPVTLSSRHHIPALTSSEEIAARRTFRRSGWKGCYRTGLCHKVQKQQETTGKARYKCGEISHRKYHGD